MSVRFAGSRCVDDRRRRRLAQEADAPTPARSRRTRSPSVSDEPEDAPRRRRHDAPADTLISPRLWKHVALSVVAVLCWSVMLYVGDAADQAATGWHQLIGLQADKLPRFFSTVALLAAGQLSLITLWYRSRSRKDFSGSYKLWFWSSLTWLTLCACRSTGYHWTLADVALQSNPITVWNARLLCWMIPTAAVTLAIYRLLLREMRDYRPSSSLLRASALAMVAAGTISLIGDWMLPERFRRLLEVGCATGWHLLLAVSMLLHARYVIHFCNEPPTSPIRRWSTVLATLLRQLTRRSGSSRDSSADENTTESGEPKASGNSSRSRTGKSPPRKRSPARKPRTTAAKSSTAAKAEKKQATETTSLKQADDETVNQPIDIEPLEEHRQQPAPSVATSRPEPAPEATSARKPSSSATSRSIEQAGRKLRIDPPAETASAAPHAATPGEDDAQVASDDEDFAALDPEALKGLSKKERRRLRKLHKEKLRRGG